MKTYPYVSGTLQWASLEQFSDALRRQGGHIKELSDSELHVEWRGEPAKIYRVMHPTGQTRIDSSLADDLQ